MTPINEVSCISMILECKQNRFIDKALKYLEKVKIDSFIANILSACAKVGQIFRGAMFCREE
jgi:hypothetical protein